MAATLRMYGSNGLQSAFEFDGNALIPITVPLDSVEDDRPQYIEAHRNHLFLSYRGGIVIHSSLGNPHEYSALTGSAELSVGDEVTGMMSSVSSVLTLFAQNRVAVLRGDDSDNWVMDTLTDDAGADAWSMQNIAGPVYFDRAGFRSLSTTDTYGNFNIGTYTELVEPLIRAKQEAGTTVKASLRCRRKNQYRIFFSDGTGMTVYFGRTPVEVCTFDLGINIEYAHSGEDANGEEILLIGDDSGFVYEMDSGQDFDGEALAAFIRLPFYHFGSPEFNKRFKKAVISVDGGQTSTIGIGVDYDYSDSDQPFSTEQTFAIDEVTLNGLGGAWGEDAFNEFYWSSPVLGRIEVYIDGFGISASMLIVSSTTYENPHTIQSVTYHYESRGLAR